MISVQNLSKQYGEQVLFKNASFSIGDRERVGFVGRNGHGKSTLFKILTGQEHYDEGNIITPQNYRIGYLNQHINFTKETVLEEGCLGLQGEQINDEWRVEKILSGLGFSEDDFFRHPGEFSGGYQIRINLAKVLVSEPNLLLLDEPTNFLDILSIRWLTGFLKLWPNELVIICHDRGFMDAVTTHTMGIHRGGIRKMKGSTSSYYGKIAQEEELQEKQRINEEKKRQDAEQFINRFRAKATKAKQVQSRIKSLEKMGETEKLDNIATLAFSFRHAPFQAKRMMEVKNITFNYGQGQPDLINDLSFTVGPEDKICIIGKNGKGKTTLLKLLAGYLKPVSGEIKAHEKVDQAYFEQSHTASLHDDMTVEEEILSNHPDKDRGASRKICGAMMFSGDFALKKISVLSGGEKCRVLLGNLLVKPANLLLLDEPSNHLDMESTDALMDATEAFQGALIMITHNEAILHRIATKLIVFHNDQVFFFDGAYSDFLSQVGWDDDDSQGEKGSKEKKHEESVKVSKKDQRKARTELTARRSALLTPLRKEMDDLERKIMEMEEKLEEENEALIKASQESDSELIIKLSKSTGELRDVLDMAYADLDRVTYDYERFEEKFEDEARNL